jgi:plasmid stabilization system protein ParE
MRLIRHPLISQDLDALVDHIVEVTQGDFAAAARRLNEAEALLRNILGNPFSGVRLTGALEGWLVRHGGRGQRLSIVFRADEVNHTLYIALIAFGGQDWMKTAAGRSGFGS